MIVETYEYVSRSSQKERILSADGPERVIFADCFEIADNIMFDYKARTDICRVFYAYSARARLFRKHPVKALTA